MRFSSETLTAIEIAKKAGKLLKEGQKKNFSISSKKGIHNLVTTYDIKSEKFILNSLKKKYPTHSFLSEEKGALTSLKTKYLWIVDPLDGTVNFAHKIPFFCVNIALQKNKETLLGVTYNPITEELFVVEKNRGAYLNNKRLKVSNTKTLNSSILATGFPYNLKSNPEKCIEKFTTVLRRGIPIRRLGTAAMDLAYLAAGRFDGYWENNLGPWDVAVGDLLVKEAGGMTTNWLGNSFKITKRNSILATNGKIHKNFLKILKKR
jgi:myo-inositol-1(or 4)-monophosphatase